MEEFVLEHQKSLEIMSNQTKSKWEIFFRETFSDYTNLLFLNRMICYYHSFEKNSLWA